MLKKTKIIIAASTLLAVGAVAAVSQTGEGRGMGRWMGGHHGMGHHGLGRDDLGGGFHGRWKGSVSKETFDGRTRERFASIDRNSDGVIDAAEVEAMIKSRMDRGPMTRTGERALERLAFRFDADRDGKVTRDEFLADAKRRFTEFDLDRDGRITDSDLPPMMRGRNAIGGGSEDSMRGVGRHVGRGMLGRLREADADRDGVVTAQEANAAAERRFASLDRNKDGVIDKADFDLLRSETVDYRVRRFMLAHGAGPDNTISRDQFAARANERFARLDRNNDGTIDRSERPGRRHWHSRGHGGDRGAEGGRGPGSVRGPAD